MKNFIVCNYIKAFATQNYNNLEKRMTSLLNFRLKWQKQRQIIQCLNKFHCLPIN